MTVGIYVLPHRRSVMGGKAPIPGPHLMKEPTQPPRSSQPAMGIQLLPSQNCGKRINCGSLRGPGLKVEAAMSSLMQNCEFSGAVPVPSPPDLTVCFP